MRENFRKGLLFTGVSFFIGLVCAILFGAIQFIVLLAWSRSLNYNVDLSSIEGSHSTILVLLMPILTGVVSVILTGLTTDSKKLSMVSGAISGLISGIVYGLLEPFFYYLMLVSIFAGIFNPLSYITDSLNILTQENFYTIVFMLTGISTISAFVCAYAIISITKNEDIGAVISPASKNTMRMIFLGIAIVLLCLFFAPPIMASIGINTGLIERHSPYSYVVDVSIAKLGNDTLMITNIGGADADLLDKDRPFTIFFNGKDVSSNDAIKSSGLQISISPASGLGYAPGSSVSLTGEDISKNNGTSIMVTGIFENGDQMILQSMYLAPGSGTNI